MPKRNLSPKSVNTRTNKKSNGFTPEERAAMRSRARELKAQSRAATTNADNQRAVLDAIAKLPEPDRTLATRLHTLITAAAPTLSPRLWYGMPAYANAAGQVVCFFQPASKFRTRYATLGFSDKATLDDGPIWPTAFAISSLSPADESRITALVAKAAS